MNGRWVELVLFAPLPIILPLPSLPNTLHTMSTELFDYIQAIKPSLGDEQRARVGLLIIHYITLLVSVISWLTNGLDRSLVCIV